MLSLVFSPFVTAAYPFVFPTLVSFFYILDTHVDFVNMLFTKKDRSTGPMIFQIAVETLPSKVTLQIKYAHLRIFLRHFPHKAETFLRSRQDPVILTYSPEYPF